MVSDKASIARLVAICVEENIQHVVISPGSRNAPLNISFAAYDSLSIYVIPDERSAAFFALGIALYLQIPTVLSCTSGTAALNYAPAIAEAYYQNIPLLVLTADRPVYAIDQAMGQTIRQNNLFSHYVKAGFELLDVDSHDMQILLHNDRIAFEAIHRARNHPAGPVHINIPIEEPLYGQEKKKNYSFSQKIALRKTSKKFNLNRLAKKWVKSSKIMVLCGQGRPDTKRDRALQNIVQREGVVVLTETNSNVHIHPSIDHIDRVLATIPAKQLRCFYPDLLVTIGGAIVSKHIKKFLAASQAEHWHIDDSNRFPDTFGLLKERCPTSSHAFFQHSAFCSHHRQEYNNLWVKTQESSHEKHEAFLQDCPWSDLKLFRYIIKTVPENSHLHLANSTPVRYAQLFAKRHDIIYYANRGVGGIDGSTSTAMGAAAVSNAFHLLITGDLSFFYDSNAFWHNHIPNNFKVIVINNQGGSIFRFIEGPDTTDILDTVFESHHQSEVRGIATAYGIKYRAFYGDENITQVLEHFYNSDTQILEIKTPRLENARILKEYFAAMKK